MAISTDVLVCGAGCAGLTAALAAARNGARVLLVERAGFAGGILTCAGLSFFDGLADFYTKRIVTPGIPLELYSKSGGCAPDAKELPSHAAEIRNVERFKHLADTLIQAEGSQLKALYHSFVCGVKMKGERITAVQVANKDGLNDIEARVVIDCTGDGDLAAWSGAPLLQFPSLQPMTMHWRVGNVAIPPGGMKELHVRMKAECEAAHGAGDLPFFYGPGAGTTFAPNELRFHCIRVPGNATNAEDLTRAEMQGRKDCWTIFERFKKNIPAFENSYFICTFPYIGIRETRRIDGRYVLTEDDLMASKRFDDAIATGTWYMDVHPNAVTVDSANVGKKLQPKAYDIPYRTIVPRGVDNLLVAGRCHSATPMASASTRVTCTAMALGQAAGYAAALAIRNGTDLHDHDGVKVREMLDASGVGPVRIE
jgi:hypothetical protein